jgi:hypothetical protein
MYSEDQLIVTRASGVITGEELSEHQKRLLADPEFNPAYRQLWHGGAATDVRTNFATMSRLSYSYEEGARRAIYAPTDLGFGMARMFEILRSDDHSGGLRVFKDLDEALAWIGLDRTTYERLTQDLDWEGVG